jgi:murein DD-endopeptidase MepM/ murein hydrolase activator NlpD
LSSSLERLLSKNFKEFSPVISYLDPSEYISIDLSVQSDLLKSVDISDPIKMDRFINNFLLSNNKKVAYGGYLEKRNLYDRSDYFNGDSKRNIHLGIDLWCPAFTNVITPFKGKVYSFANNMNYGDYGPTIILEHQLENITFYTLYGHLSVSSLNGLRIGQSFDKGERIAQLGNYLENGSYAPHLHFQIIDDISSFDGDYPGVSDEKNKDFYKINCPDPNLILRLK